MSIISSTVTGSKRIPITPKSIIGDKRFSRVYTVGKLYSPPYFKTEYYVCKKAKSTNPYRICIVYSNVMSHDTSGEADNTEIMVFKVENGKHIKIENVVSMYDWKNRVLKNYFELP